MHQFLADDFARLGTGPIDRCMKLEGRLYLSGATGFFGKNLLSLLMHLQGRGGAFRVTALSRSPERFLSDQPWCRDQAWLEWQKGDVLDHWPGQGDYDFLLHAAGDTTSDAHRDNLSLFENIVTATRNALDFTAAHGVRRILLCGSGAQYGAIPESYARGVPEASLQACDPTKLGSAYGEAKRASEMLAALLGDKHGFDVVSARCFAFVGPGLVLDGHFAIGNFIRDAILGKPIHLSTDGEARRSYLYGADLAVWLLLLLIEADKGAVVNVGSDRAIRVLELANLVRDVVNPSVAVQAGARPSDGDRHFYVPSVARAKALGLDAWTNLEQAIARTAQWHRANGMGVQDGAGA
jgi:dTDP-glucose 4,6-dehydratase